MWSGQWPGPEPAGSGRAWASNMTIVLRAGPGLDILFAGRVGPGPHNSVCGPGPGRVCTTAAGPGRAWASNHICGPGLGLNFRPVQDPSMHPCYCTSWWVMILTIYIPPATVGLLVGEFPVPQSRLDSVSWWNVGICLFSDVTKLITAQIVRT